ncbi:MAG: hypothetical protein JW827_03225 [Spirochaetes bacterium]|nr:hypothetical protein [Spirochaetota bacterium]
MKRLLLILIVLSMGSILLAEDDDFLMSYKVLRYPFYIYSNAESKLDRGIPSGWMGDIRDIRMDNRWDKNTRSGSSALRVTYTAAGEGDGWAGLYFQSNPNNYWISIRGGYDLTPAKKVYFYARGKHGNEVVEFSMNRTRQQNPKDSKTSKKIVLSKEWKKYEIDLSCLELKDIAGGFGFVLYAKDNPDGCTFYVDDVYYSNNEESTSLSAQRTAYNELN